jgi:hypothetical protein
MSAVLAEAAPEEAGPLGVAVQAAKTSGRRLAAAITVVTRA